MSVSGSCARGRDRTGALLAPERPGSTGSGGGEEGSPQWGETGSDVDFTQQPGGAGSWPSGGD